MKNKHGDVLVIVIDQNLNIFVKSKDFGIVGVVRIWCSYIWEVRWSAKGKHNFFSWSCYLSVTKVQIEKLLIIPIPASYS